MRRIISYANVASTLALVIALSGGAYAAGLIGTSQIKNGAVTGPKIHLGAVGNTKLARHAVSNGKLLGGSVDSRVIKNGTVGADDIAGAFTTAISDAIFAATPRMVQTSDSTIQSIGPSTMTLANMTFAEPGTYLVTGTLRVFPGSGSNHQLFCDMSSDGGGGISLVNVAVDAVVREVPFTGLITTFTPGEVKPVTCRQGTGALAGQITATYDLFGVKVVPAS